jgi:hypothetical protein
MDGKHTQADLEALRRVFQENPQLTQAGDLCDVAFDTAARALGGNKDAFSELVKAWREFLRGDLGFADAMPAERLLIDEITLCWLRHYEAEVQYTEVSKKGMTFAQGEYWDRKVNATQRRYLRAVRRHPRSPARARIIAKCWRVPAR